MALTTIFSLGLVRCELPHEVQPSVMVVAVEGLSFASLGCDNEESTDRNFESLRPFCEESVRFSHAFTPSTMSQASLASLMTGLYPFDHGVHNNGSDFLSAKFKTLAETALGHGYRTFFATGGAPIWRKSGLAQGFEVFDDNMEISPGNYYRPAEEVVKLTTNWVDHESPAGPFLSVMFLNDLQFPQIATRTNEGEVREKTAEAQLEEVTESLNNLVKWLKRKHRWNSTYVVLVGTSSLQHRENDNDPVPMSLRSSSVQVTLFIKPARTEKDNVIQWAVDRNVSLVDVGKTMFGWIGAESGPSSLSELEPESLNAALTQSEPNWPEDRLIASESAWPEWIEGAGIRTAIRQNQFLYIADQRPMIFNTLTDRLETLPLKANDPLWTSLNSEVFELTAKAKIPRWQGMQGHWLEMIEVARELWRGEGVNLRHPRGNEAWAKWYLRRALVAREWREVRRLALASNEPVGAFVANRHLGENPPMPRNACVRLVLGTHLEKPSYQAECEDDQVIALHNWQTAKGDEEQKSAQDRFVRLYSMGQMDQQIGRMNFLNELRWDVDRETPEAPPLVDYLLTLKELEPYHKKVSSLLSNKDLAF